MRDEMENAAIDWVIRQRDPDFADWEAFTTWLSASPDHATVYDKVAAFDGDLDALPHHEPSIAERGHFLVSRRTWLSGAVAAALVAVTSFSMIGNGSNRIETAAGEHRTIALADGSRIEVNGGSVIEIDKSRPRFARLEQGEAMFHVVHHEGDPFMVEAGDAKIVDLGTAFNVVRRDRGTSVAVSEGVVVYNPGRDNVRINAGKGVDAVEGAGRPVLRDIDVNGVGGWRTGQLVYGGTSIAQVAEDLTRTTGVKIEVSPHVAGLPFRGALLVNKDKAQTMADLSALAGIRAEKRADGWLLTR